MSAASGICTIIDKTGEIISLGSFSDDTQRDANLPPGGEILPSAPPSREHYRLGAAWVRRPDKPGEQHVWNKTAKTWTDTRTLSQAQANKWFSIKSIRSSKAAGTFSEGGREYNCDPVAIAMAATNAMLAKAALELTWTKAWTLADNSTATLTANQVLLMARACDDYITGLWATGRTLRKQIDAAATIVAVDAIAWPQGA